MHYRLSFLRMTAAVLLLFAVGGCTDTIGTAARSSLASFLTTVFSSAVSDALGP